MKNLRPFDENTLDFFDQVAAARRPSVEDPHFITRVLTYRPGLITAYTQYNLHFGDCSLMLAVAIGHINPTKADLIKLYHYKAKVFQSLQLRLTTDENNRLINTCQNCTINEVNSFDHILPKDEFPEFAVNPRNLFPSCTQCNSYKSYVWRDSGIGLFLNLFLDVLPVEQYLFVDIVINEGIKLDFTVENRNGLDAGLFRLISSHYQRLHLTKRFSRNSEGVITELINAILSYKGDLSKEKIRQVVIAKANRDKQTFGYNYWKAIAVIELINSNDFFAFAVGQ